MVEYTYNREKFNYHIHGVNYIKPSQKYGNIETIHPITSLFIKNIHDYHFNNEIIESHVNNIYTKILNDDDRIIIGSFTVIQCYDDNNNLYLIDGHHRKEALIRIMNDNKDNIYIDSEESPCGSKITCKHCQRCMELITPKLIIERILKSLNL